MVVKRKLGTKIERVILKAQRKLGGKEIVISKAPKGSLSRGEAKDVLSVLAEALRKGLLPGVTYEYHPEPLPWAKDTILIRPGSGEPSALAPKLRAVIKSRFGDKYRVALR